MIHGISLPPARFGGPAIARLFTNGLRAGSHPGLGPIAALRVSAHFLVRRHGELIQFVPCDWRAWHAGASRWRDRERCNDFSIGIELEGTDDVRYTSRQYRVLAQLTRALLARYPITDIVGHSDVAPGRKTDPGPSFEWTRYRRLLGLSGAARVHARMSGSGFPEFTFPVRPRAPRLDSTPGVGR